MNIIISDNIWNENVVSLTEWLKEFLQLLLTTKYVYNPVSVVSEKLVWAVFAKKYRMAIRKICKCLKSRAWCLAGLFFHHQVTIISKDLFHSSVAKNVRDKIRSFSWRCWITCNRGNKARRDEMLGVVGGIVVDLDKCTSLQTFTWRNQTNW